MKIIIPFFASLFVAAMTFGQEESPAPTESTAPAAEEKASATVETTPEAAPAEASSPASQKKEEPMAAPAKAAKKETAATTATAAKPATAAAPATTGKNLTGEAAIKDMENRWEASVPSHNYSVVEGFVATDFTGVSSKGKFTNRSQMLSEAKADKDTYKSAKNEKLNVRMYGPNVAIVTGRAREIGTGKDGKAFDRTYLFTDTWVMRAGKWQCAGSQVNKIKG